MSKPLVYPLGTTPACQYATQLLQRRGIPITDHPTPDATHLFLDVPSFAPDGSLRCGIDLSRILSMLPPNITVIGGNLDHPDLLDHPLMDLLKDEDYIAKNAAITAHCALSVAAQHIQTTFRDTHTLILGWGRIGKCLCSMLKALDTPVSVAVRSPKDRALLHALGYDPVELSGIDLRRFELVINTVPHPLLSRTQLDIFPDIVKIDLASRPGLEGAGVIYARGLPGIHTPKSSGKLIAETILKEVTP